MGTKAGSQAGFTKETSPFLSGAPGLPVRHLSRPPISHLWFSLPAPLSTRPNKRHPRMAASALHLHDFTAHSILWRPRDLGEKLSDLAWAVGGGRVGIGSGLWPGGWDPMARRGACPWLYLGQLPGKGVQGWEKEAAPSLQHPSKPFRGLGLQSPAF